MKKIILVGLAILAVSTSGALAAKKATKPKAPAAAATTTTTTTTTTTNPGGAAPFMLGQVSASDRELYEKSQRESGMKK
jgi:ABC-type transport system substrate-binding protein